MGGWGGWGGIEKGNPNIHTNLPQTLLYESEIHTPHFSILHVLDVATNSLFYVLS